LAGGNKGTGGQHLDLLGVVDFGTSIDHFLLGFEELLSEVSELKDFPFDEWISQSLHCAINELLVRLSILENTLAKGVEWRLGAVSRSSS
jgi:hypothetical protein